jgi:hypothetical protein
MTDLAFIQETLEKIVVLLVRRKFVEAAAISRPAGPTPSELRDALDQFPQQLIDPPADAYRSADITEVRGRDEYHVAFDLWTRESQPSDLTLELRFVRNGSGWHCAIEDLHVL